MVSYFLTSGSGYKKLNRFLAYLSNNHYYLTMHCHFFSNRLVLWYCMIFSYFYLISCSLEALITYFKSIEISCYNVFLMYLFMYSTLNCLVAVMCVTNERLQPIVMLILKVFSTNSCKPVFRSLVMDRLEHTHSMMGQATEH